MEGLIGNVVSPPFQKVGVFGLDTFYPQPERMELAMQLNAVIASPSFSAWTQGQPLDIHKMLYGENGRPQTAICSIAHLSESERMFFVTMLLNRLVDWMRKQEGISSLRALLYMDEIFGFFPPTANPPSKKPMLLLLKQARAYGLGVVLATQNPVDLDYKGLSNIGTWFVGRLQTTQDQNRVIDGIAGSSDGGLQKSDFRKLLADMAGRQFLLRSAHLDEPLLFETRWVMSYLKGPISKTDIKKLMANRDAGFKTPVTPPSIPRQAAPGGRAAPAERPPLIADTMRQRFYLPPVPADTCLLEPWLAASGSVRFFNAKRNIDDVRQVSLRICLDDAFTEPRWPDAEKNPYGEDELLTSPPAGARYYPLCRSFLKNRDLRPYAKTFSEYLYQNWKLELYRAASLKMESRPGESKEDFGLRLADRLRERRDQALEKMQEKYRGKTERLEKKIDKALLKVEKEKLDVSTKTTDTVLSFGATVLGALFGRKGGGMSTITRASRGVRSAGRLSREKGDVKRAQAAVQKLQAEMDRLVQEIEAKTAALSDKFTMDTVLVEPFFIKPRRSDIFNLDLCLLWEMVVPDEKD